jgi:predicted component of type VI protein secretion system
MTLVLRGITRDEEPMSQPLIGRFDERGGTLGRSDDATLTLPDPERLISRLQAQILHRDEHYWLENISAASAVLHNGRPLSVGMRVILSEGDELRIGEYALQAAFEDEASSATVLRGRTVVPPVHNTPSPPVKASTTPATAPVPEVGEPPAEPPPSRGFLDGPAALRDALTDLQSHQVGTTAGMQAVLQAVLDRLDPEKLATLQDRRSMFDFLWPARRRARLWDAYLSQYRTLREEAKDNFQRFFGEVFREAYEAQVRNLDKPGDITGLRAGSGKPQTPQRR